MDEIDFTLMELHCINALICDKISEMSDNNKIYYNDYTITEIRNIRNKFENYTRQRIRIPL